MAQRNLPGESAPLAGTREGRLRRVMHHLAAAGRAAVARNAKVEVVESVAPAADSDAGRRAALRARQEQARAGRAPEIGIRPGETRELNGECTRIKEFGGRLDGMGGNIVGSFVLKGADGKPIDFSVLVREDGRNPMDVAKGIQDHRVIDPRDSQPSVTVIRTEDLGVLQAIYQSQLPAQARYSAAQTVRGRFAPAGEAVRVGRDNFPELSDGVSGQAVEVGISRRPPVPPDGYPTRSAMVTITDISLNGHIPVARPAAL